MIAGRLAAGSILGAPIDEMPNGRLYYAGGGSSVRGYAYRSLGPEKNGAVTGGLSHLEGSLEVRAKVTDSFGVVGFVDAGNAFASSYPDFSESLRLAAGGGPSLLYGARTGEARRGGATRSQAGRLRFRPLHRPRPELLRRRT